MKELKPENKLNLTKLLASKGIQHWADAINYVRFLPYGRNMDRSDFSLVISENKGTCSSKHAFLKAYADENRIGDVLLIMGIFRMNALNTPKIKPILETYNIDFIPEAHCYLKVSGIYTDVTSGAASFENIKGDIIEEMEIQPHQTGQFKIDFHQEFLKKWLTETKSLHDFTKFWSIREECIQSLSV